MASCPHCSSDSVKGRYCGRCGKPVDVPVKKPVKTAPAQKAIQPTPEKVDLERLEADLKKNPDQPEAYINLARAQLGQGRQEQAYSTFRAGRTIAPDHTELLRAGGEILETLNRREDAIEIFEKVLKQAPDDINTALKLTGLLYETGQRQAALRHLTRLDQQAESHPEILIRIAQIHLSLGNAAEAQASLGRYRDIAGNTREMFILMGQTMLTRKFFDGAVKNFREAIRFFPEDSAMRLGLGKAYLGMGEKGQALLEFEQGLNKSPGNIDILIELGKLQNAMGMEDQADDTFGRIEKSNSVTGEGLLELARHFTDRNNLNRAMKYLKMAQEISPYHAGILKELGHTCERLKDFAQATKIYEQTLQTSPGAIWAHEGVIRCAGTIGNHKLKAISQRKLLEKSPTAELWCDLGETLIRISEFDKAQEAFEQAAKLDPTCVRAYQAPELIKQEKARAEGEKLASQAQEALNKKFFLTAAERLEKALELVPNETSWLKLLAQVSLKTAEIERASGLLAKVRATDPADFASAFNLARAYEFEDKTQLAIELLSSTVKDHPLELQAQLMLLRLKRSQLRSSRVEPEMFEAMIRNIELDLTHLRKESAVPLLVKGYACLLFSFRSKLQQEGFNKAEACFNEVIARFGESEDAVAGLALVERARGNTEKAVEKTKNLIRISSDPRKLFVLARVHENFQQFGEARKCYSSLSNLFPENGLYRKKVVEMTAELSKISSKNELMNMLSEHTQSLQGRPDQVWLLFENALAQQYLAEFSTQKDEWVKKSLLNWHKAANHLQTNHWVRWQMLEAQFSFLQNVEKQRAAANNLKACEKIVREMPDNSLAYRALGQCYLAFSDLTNTDKALKFFEKAWFLSTDYSDTGILLAKTAKELGKSVIVDAVGYNMLLLEPELALSVFQL
jgi:tetratricopeptide (TPR) repeat protein